MVLALSHEYTQLGRKLCMSEAISDNILSQSTSNSFLEFHSKSYTTVWISLLKICNTFVRLYFCLNKISHWTKLSSNLSQRLPRCIFILQLPLRQQWTINRVTEDPTVVSQFLLFDASRPLYCRAAIVIVRVQETAMVPRYSWWRCIWAQASVHECARVDGASAATAAAHSSTAACVCVVLCWNAVHKFVAVHIYLMGVSVFLLGCVLLYIYCVICSLISSKFVGTDYFLDYCMYDLGIRVVTSEWLWIVNDTVACVL